MIPLVAKQAVSRKVEFPKAKLTGNYECAYAAGILSSIMGIAKKDSLDNLTVVLELIKEKASEYKSDNERINKLLELYLDYEPSDLMDEQMMELYLDGYNEGKI